VPNIIQSKSDIPFTQDDLMLITKIIKEKPLRYITKTEKVYFVLKQIGRPAHFSEVADTYTEMFPEESVTEHSIHAVLLHEKNGVVWTGSKGTFALEEWGYERPPISIHDAVAEIVKQRYEVTGNPVRFNVIEAEIGKYRKFINPNSIMIAAYCNPRLNNVYNDYFVPKDDDVENGESEINDSRLDQVLREFEEKTKGDDRNMVDEMTYDRKLEIATQALEAYKKAGTKQEVEEIFIKYGRSGIGYRSLCKMFFSQKPPEDVVQAHKNE